MNGYGTCGVCKKRRVALRADGRLYVHQDRRADSPRWRMRCEGSGSDPLNVDTPGIEARRRAAAERDAAELPWQDKTPRARRPEQETR